MRTLLISAGDASGDMHAADFVRAFRERHPDTRFVGLGGGRLEEAGVELVADQRDLAVGGILELAGSASRIVSTWRRMSAAVVKERPDLVVLVDSGGFNLPFARRVRRRSRAQILYYVAPQVWAWRRRRIHKLAKRVHRMAVIFPFEPEVYSGTGLEVEFVGHPLVESLAAAASRWDRATARRELRLARDAKLVAILPGSRRNEIHHQLPVQLAAARRLLARQPGTQFALGLAPSIAPGELTRVVEAASLPADLSLDIISGRTPELIRASNVVLAKPGTVTIEITLLDRPMVVVGVASPLTAAIVRRAVKLDWFSMPNLIAGEAIVPEFVQEKADPESVADALADLLEEPGCGHQLARLRKLKRQLGKGGAARRTVEIAEEMLERPSP